VKIFLLIALASILNSAWAVEARFFLGTYTLGETSKGIYTCTLDLETGRLGPVALAAEADNPSYLAITPNGNFLYAASEVSPHGLTIAFRVEAGGKLVRLNQQSSGGAGTCHVSVDASGRYVFAANYGDGNISCFRTQEAGSLGEAIAFIQLREPDPVDGSERKSRAHSVDTDPSNRFLYSCDLGTDNIWIFTFDPESGKLEENSPPAAKAPKGSGPRHLVIHPSTRYLYANTEMGCSVSAFERDAISGALTPLQVIPTLPEGTPRAGTTTAEIACHPTGKWLYVSNRGADTIATFAIGREGRLTWVANAAAGVKVPRGFAIDRSGRWLIVAGQKDNRIVVLEIDQTTGEPRSTGQVASVASPVCVLFAPTNEDSSAAIVE
jgi:6-phosphogluconolactonase